MCIVRQNLHRNEYFFPSAYKTRLQKKGVFSVSAFRNIDIRFGRKLDNDVEFFFNVHLIFDIGYRHRYFSFNVFTPTRYLTIFSAIHIPTFPGSPSILRLI